VWIDGILTHRDAAALGERQRVNMVPCMGVICCKCVLFGELYAARALLPGAPSSIHTRACCPGSSPSYAASTRSSAGGRRPRRYG
jgi:hypothetical protein